VKGFSMNTGEPAHRLILGVQVPKALLSVTHARKYQAGVLWVLATRKGAVIARFASEAELQNWWRFFQESQGRTVTDLTCGPPPPQRPKLKSRAKNWDDYGKHGHWW
jgi:hypothetical protein